MTAWREELDTFEYLVHVMAISILGSRIGSNLKQCHVAKHTMR